MRIMRRLKPGALGPRLAFGRGKRTTCLLGCWGSGVLPGQERSLEPKKGREARLQGTVRPDTTLHRGLLHRWTEEGTSKQAFLAKDL